MDNITPRDAAETATLSVGARITAAIGIIGTAFTTVLAAIGGLDWITANLPMLLTGLGSLATGGIASYIAVRRMRIDRLAGKAPLILLLALPVLLLSGCAVVSGKAGESHYVGFGCGEKASSTLAGLNITETQTAKGKIVTERGVGVDNAGAVGQADIGKILGSLLLLGLQSQGLPVAAQASAANQADATDPDVAADSPDPAAAVAYSTDGYAGTPGASGEGVYGRPSCSRCRAYKAAHPDIAMINIDTASNRSDLWAALRLRGYTGSSISLPVQITADGYTQAAK